MRDASTRLGLTSSARSGESPTACLTSRRSSISILESSSSGPGAPSLRSAISVRRWCRIRPTLSHSFGSARFCSSRAERPRPRPHGDAPWMRYQLWELGQAIEQVPMARASARGQLALTLGALLQREAELGYAEDQYRLATALLPDNANAWNNLGVA